MCYLLHNIIFSNWNILLIYLLLIQGSLSFMHPILISVAVVFGVLLLIFVLSRVLAPRFSYEGCHVLVTGGSSGIGLEAAKGAHSSTSPLFHFL